MPGDPVKAKLTYTLETDEGKGLSRAIKVKIPQEWSIEHAMDVFCSRIVRIDRKAQRS